MNSLVDLLPSLEFVGEALPFKDIASKKTCPSMLRIIKGHYSNIGVQKLPLVRMTQDVLLYSVSDSVKVFCHSVRPRYDRRSKQDPCALMPINQRLSISLSYKGWFEVLSEDGKAAKPIENVRDLAKRFPARCIIRQSIKAFSAGVDGKVDCSRQTTLPTGKLVSLVSTEEQNETTVCDNAKSSFLKISDGNEMYFMDYKQTGLFTPVAGRYGISGVHQIRDIVAKFRLPLTVKLTQGVWPNADRNQFTGIIRLDWAYNDSTAFVCPISNENLKMLPIPTDTTLKVIPANIVEEIRTMEAFQEVSRKCGRMVTNYDNSIQLISKLPDSVVLTRYNSNGLQQNLCQELYNDCKTSEKLFDEKDVSLLEEIDNIYQYVRDGGIPPQTADNGDMEDGLQVDEPIYETICDVRNGKQNFLLETKLTKKYPTLNDDVCDTKGVNTTKRILRSENEARNIDSGENTTGHKLKLSTDKTLIAATRECLANKSEQYQNVFTTSNLTKVRCLSSQASRINENCSSKDDKMMIDSTNFEEKKLSSTIGEDNMDLVNRASATPRNDLDSIKNSSSNENHFQCLSPKTTNQDDKILGDTSIKSPRKTRNPQEHHFECASYRKTRAGALAREVKSFHADYKNQIPKTDDNRDRVYDKVYSGKHRLLKKLFSTSDGTGKWSKIQSSGLVALQGLLVGKRSRSFPSMDLNRKSSEKCKSMDQNYNLNNNNNHFKSSCNADAVSELVHISNKSPTTTKATSPLGKGTANCNLPMEKEKDKGDHLLPVYCKSSEECLIENIEHNERQRKTINKIRRNVGLLPLAISKYCRNKRLSSGHVTSTAGRQRYLIYL